MTSNSRVAPYVARQLRALQRELVPTVPRVVRGGDEEAIHDLRVAIRRLRTMLKIARSLYGRFHADAVRGAFTQVHRATGALRDEEVLEKTLAGVDLRSDVWTAWCGRRRARERALRRAVIRRLRAGELTRANAMLRALVTLPVKPARDRGLGKFARGVVERARRRVEARRDVETSDVVGLHELRIAYKELRYSAELFAPALPLDVAALAEPAARFQKRLGEIHDVDVALLAVRRARGLDAVTRVEALARLEAMRSRKVVKYVSEMAPAKALALEAAPEDVIVHAEPVTPEPMRKRPAREALLN